MMQWSIVLGVVEEANTASEGERVTEAVFTDASSSSKPLSNFSVEMLWQLL